MIERLPLLLFSLFTATCLLGGCAPEARQDPVAPFWSSYDESSEVTALAELPDKDLHFTQLNSSLRDKNTLWNHYTAELSAFGTAEYQRLQPLILEASVHELQQAVAEGRLSYEALTLFYLYRIRAIEGDRARYLNAVIATNPLALEQARAADQALRNGGVKPDPDSLFGIPVLLKDNIAASGMATTAGAAVLQHNMSANAFVVDRLLEHGAVILGKTNLSEWAYFFCDDCPSGWSAIGGQTLNPYGRFAFGTGGSSSGSGAAAAANLAAVTVGSETSGSILSPASRHGAVGFKPTTGRLSRSGVIPISSTLDTTGPITRSVRDAISLFNAMEGLDTNDFAMDPAHIGPLDYSALSLTGQKLGYVSDWLEQPMYASAIMRLQAAGASMIAVDLPRLALEGFDTFLGGEMRRDLAGWLQRYGSVEPMPTGVADVVAFNNTNPPTYAPYGQALFEQMQALPLSDSEVAVLGESLQSSATAALAALYTDNALDALLLLDNRSAGLAALANYPALTLPLGLDEQGQPHGLTLVKPGWEEQALVSLALSVEQLVGARSAPAAY
jgi:amidase